MLWELLDLMNLNSCFHRGHNGTDFFRHTTDGNLHLGNYLGAIRNWVKLQDLHESLFCIVDLHALTTLPDPKQLRMDIRGIAAAYIAAGIDPEKSYIFPSKLCSRSL